MCGLFPDREQLLKGVGIAVVLACVILPFFIWLDPVFQKAIADIGDISLLRMQYPSTSGGVIALILFSSGFETMFFHFSV